LSVIDSDLFLLANPLLASSLHIHKRATSRTQRGELNSRGSTGKVGPGRDMSMGEAETCRFRHEGDAARTVCRYERRHGLLP
jgi:hypothetical protein